MLTLLSIFSVYHKIGMFLYLFAVVITLFSLYRQTKRWIDDALGRGPERDAEERTQVVAKSLGPEMFRLIGGHDRIFKIMLNYPDDSTRAIVVLLWELFTEDFHLRKLEYSWPLAVSIANDFLYTVERMYIADFGRRLNIRDWDEEARASIEQVFDFTIKEHLEADIEVARDIPWQVAA